MVIAYQRLAGASQGTEDLPHLGHALPVAVVVHHRQRFGDTGTVPPQYQAQIVRRGVLLGDPAIELLVITRYPGTTLTHIHASYPLCLSSSSLPCRLMLTLPASLPQAAPKETAPTASPLRTHGCPQECCPCCAPWAVGYTSPAMMMATPHAKTTAASALLSSSNTT